MLVPTKLIPGIPIYTCNKCKGEVYPKPYFIGWYICDTCNSLTKNITMKRRVIDYNNIS